LQNLPLWGASSAGYPGLVLFFYIPTQNIAFRLSPAKAGLQNPGFNWFGALEKAPLKILSLSELHFKDRRRNAI
jgi:hypothetical protein